MREDGFNSGWRNIGRLALWTIPLSLGAAACVWLGFAIATHNWFNVISQERRRTIYVGAQNPPKEKIKIETPTTGCLIIDRVDLEGSYAAVYFHNKCRSSVDNPRISYQLKSPDGTLLGSDWWWVSVLDGPSVVHPGDKAEAVFSGWLHGIKTDKRAASIVFEFKE